MQEDFKQVPKTQQEFEQLYLGEWVENTAERCKNSGCFKLTTRKPLQHVKFVRCPVCVNSVIPESQYTRIGGVYPCVADNVYGRVELPASVYDAIDPKHFIDSKPDDEGFIYLLANDPEIKHLESLGVIPIGCEDYFKIRKAEDK